LLWRLDGLDWILENRWRLASFSNPPLPRMEEIHKIVEEFIKLKLTPTAGYVREGNFHADKVFKLCESFSELKVGRAVIGGSMGKDSTYFLICRVILKTGFR